MNQNTKEARNFKKAEKQSKASYNKKLFQKAVVSC